MPSKWKVDENKAWFKKWWPDNVPKNYDFEELNLGEFFERQRKKYANDNLMHFIESWMTYDEAGNHMDSFGTALHNLGIKKGDTVALLLPNSFQYVIAFYGAAKIGAIATGINPTYKPLEVLHHINLTKAKCLV